MSEHEITRRRWMARIQTFQRRAEMAEANCATVHDAVDVYRRKLPEDYKDLGWLDVAIAVIGDAPDMTALIRELTKALEDLGNWLAFGLEKPDGEEVTAEDLQRCQEVAEQAGAAVAKGHRFLGNLGSCTFPSQVAAALVVERAKMEERQEKHGDAVFGIREGDDQC